MQSQRAAETLATDSPHPLAEEDRLRADIYSFLARHLLAAPDARSLADTAALNGDDTDFGRAFSTLAAVAGESDAAAVSAEYEALFIGLGRGELVPFGSYYLTGFLNEKPLAELRQSLRTLGVERRSEVREPEDHIGILAEIMAGLITGSYGPPSSFAEQQQFFRDHIEPWAGHFFRDLSEAETARFYTPVGKIGALFMQIEQDAFAMG